MINDHNDNPVNILIWMKILTLDQLPLSSSPNGLAVPMLLNACMGGEE